MGREEQMLNCDGTLSIMYGGLFADIENVNCCQLSGENAIFLQDINDPLMIS